MVGGTLDLGDVVTLSVVAWLVVGAVAPPVVAMSGGGSADGPRHDVTAVPDADGSGPNATLTGVPIGVPAEERVTVSAANVSNATYEFDWGDGETTTGSSSVASHRYDSTGRYTITLTVIDGAGRSDTATRTIRVDDATDRRVTAVDDSRPGTVDAGDPRTGDDRRYEPVSFRGREGSVVTVATDTDAPVRLSIRRAGGGRERVLRDRRDATRNPALRGVELPADGTYTVRVTADRADRPVEYDLAVTQLAPSPGNDSAAETADPGRLAIGTTVNGTIGRDDLQSVEGVTGIEATSFEGSAGDRVRLTFDDPDRSPSVAVVAGPKLPPTRVESGTQFDLPGTGTYSVTVRARDTPRSYALTLSAITAGDRRLVVDADGRVGNYTTIGSALEAASAGDTVVVRPGTYRERVRLPESDLRLVAPDGATLVGNGSGVGITLPLATGPAIDQTVDGFTIRGYGTGIEQAGLIGTFDGLRLRNVTVRNSSDDGVVMPIGDWSIRNATVRDSGGFGVSVADGDWSMRNVALVNNTRGGIDALGALGTTEGDWAVRDATIRDNGGSGIRAGNTAGDWTVADTRIVGNADETERRLVGNASAGIVTAESSGAWRLDNVTVADNAGTGVDAQRTTGNWTITTTAIERNDGEGIDTIDSDAAWAVSNVTVDDNGGEGIDALDSTGAWTVVASRITDSASDGVRARDAGGRWRVVGSTLADNVGSGVDAAGTTGDWRVVRSTLSANGDPGIYAVRSDGDWTVLDASIRGHDDGIDAEGSDGDWRVVGSRITGDRADRDGVDASSTTGAWVVAGTVVTNVSTGVSAARSEGDWTIRRSVVARHDNHGINARFSDGDWLVESTAVRDNGDLPPVLEPRGIDARNTSGAWIVRRSNVVGNDDVGIDAQRADREGDAQRNWWGQPDGPTLDQCGGTVDCSAPLGSPADVGPRSVDEADATINVSGVQTVGEPLRFDGLNSTVPGTIVSWQFDFGDGTIATSDRFLRDPPVATHRYESAGTYNVTLTVTDDRGRTDSVRRTVDVRAAGVEGPVSFEPTPENATAGQAITFDATGSAINDSVAQYEWRFGDGATATGPVVDHAYEDEREYEVRLIAILDNGTIEETARTVAIEGQTYYVNDPDSNDSVDIRGGAPEFGNVLDAVETASDGDRVVVGPGDYALNEPLPIDANITLVAPDPVAILRPGEAGPVLGIRIEGDVSPEIAGFKIVDFETGVRAGVAAGDWSVRNASFGGPELQTGIDASAATGGWTVEGVTVLPEASASAGVVASAGAGEWEVDNAEIAVNGVGIDVQGGVDAKQIGWRVSKTVIRRADTPSPGELVGTGIDAAGTASDWAVEDTSVRGMQGVSANDTSGNWTLDNVTVADGRAPAVNASGTTGDWRARDLTLSNQSVGVDATGTTGEWEISRSNITANGVGVRAFDVDTTGDARRNWWGQPGGPTPAQCRGDVRCGNPLGEPPTGNATGFEVQALSGSPGQPMAGVTVFAFAATVDRPPRSPNESAQAKRHAGAEHYVGPQLSDAVASATTGPEGVVRLTGLTDRRSTTDYCYLAVPPADSPRDVRFDCVTVDEDSVTETTTLFTNDTLTRDAAWPQIQGGPARTGNASVERPTGPVAARWTAASATAPAGESRSLIAADGSVYVVGAETVEAYDATTGDRRWTTRRAAEGFSAAAFADGRLHVIGRDRLYAFDAASGGERWRVPITDGSSATASNLVAADGSVYATAAVDDQLYVTAVDGDGDVRWTTERDRFGGLSGPPAVADGRVYVTTSSQLTAIDATTGTLAWETRTPLDTVAPTVADGTVFVSTDAGGGRVVAYDAADGTQRTEYVIGESPTSSGVRFGGSPAVADGRVVVADAGRTGDSGPLNVTAVDLDAGDTAWRTPVLDRVRRTPVVAEGVVHVATAGRVPTDRDGRVYGLDAETGDVRWTYDESGDLAPVRAPLAVADGAVYLVDGNGTVHAVESATPPTRQASVTTVDGTSRVSVPGADAGEAATATVDRRIGADGARLANVSVEFDRPTTDATFTIEPIAERPATLPAVGASADPAFLQIEDSRVDDDAIDSATFVIDLPAGSVDDRDAVTVFRYHDGSWRSLDTRLFDATTSGGEEILRYEVTTPGFSVFAVDPGTGPSGGDGGSTGGDTDGGSGTESDSGDDGGSTGGDTDGSGAGESSAGSDTDGSGGGVDDADDSDVSTATSEPPTRTATPATTTPGASDPPADTPADTPRSDAPDDSTVAPTGAREPAGFDPSVLVGFVVVLVVALAVLLRRRET